jgi:DNA-directed RNA polymerase subunit RPC12/RpoP
MGRKKPWLAAVLNFLLSGTGFIYCEKAPFAIGGGILLIFSIIQAAILWFNMGRSSLNSMFSSLIVALVDSTALAILGYGAAKSVNAEKPAQTVQTTVAPTAPAPPAPETPILYTCSACTTPLSYVKKDDKWYCTRCQQYTAVYDCQKCGKPLTYIREYNRWYCQNCKEYS